MCQQRSKLDTEIYELRFFMKNYFKKRHIEVMRRDKNKNQWTTIEYIIGRGGAL